MTPEGRKIWNSPAGASLLRSWMDDKPVTPQAEKALTQLKTLNQQQTKPTKQKT